MVHRSIWGWYLSWMSGVMFLRKAIYSSVWNFVMSCQEAGFVICIAEVHFSIHSREIKGRLGPYTHVQFSVDVIVNDEVVDHAHSVRFHRMLSFSCSGISNRHDEGEVAYLHIDSCRHHCGRNSSLSAESSSRQQLQKQEIRNSKKGSDEWSGGVGKSSGRRGKLRGCFGRDSNGRFYPLREDRPWEILFTVLTFRPSDADTSPSAKCFQDLQGHAGATVQFLPTAETRS